MISTPLELPSRFGDKALKCQVICPQLSPERDCGPKRVKHPLVVVFYLWSPLCPYQCSPCRLSGTVWVFVGTNIFSVEFFVQRFRSSRCSATPSSFLAVSFFAGVPHRHPDVLRVASVQAPAPHLPKAGHSRRGVGRPSHGGQEDCPHRLALGGGSLRFFCFAKLTQVGLFFSFFGPHLITRPRSQLRDSTTSDHGVYDDLHKIYRIFFFFHLVLTSGYILSHYLPGENSCTDLKIFFRTKIKTVPFTCRKKNE